MFTTYFSYTLLLSLTSICFSAKKEKKKKETKLENSMEDAEA